MLVYEKSKYELINTFSLIIAIVYYASFSEKDEFKLSILFPVMLRLALK